MKDNIASYEISTDKLILGVDKVCNVLRPTYGPGGSNVVIEENLMPFHRVANDGKLIVDSIKLADPIENIGANILKEATNKAEKESGDGRKTTSILCQAILNEAKKIKGVLPMDIKRSLDEALHRILEAIDAQKKDIPVEEIGKVASISAENEEVGRLVQEIYTQIGREGIIEHEPSNLPTTYYEITEGVRIRGAGMFGAYSSTEPGKAVYKNPKILIVKDKIVSVDQISDIFKTCSQNQVNELVIYCEDIDLSVASRLALTHLQGGFKTLIIKAPSLFKDWTFEDLAAMTGATPIESKEGATFKSFKLEWLGTCAKLIATPEETRVIGIKDLTDHINLLKEKATDDNQFLVRVGWLQTKVAVLKVGANSESELSYLIKKAKDACSASYWALKEGVVPGAGLALQQAVHKSAVPEEGVASDEPSVGETILANALQVPAAQIQANLGKEVEGDVIDPAIVVKNAVKNAVSIAGTILTAKGVITLPREPQKEPHPLTMPQL